MAARIHEVRTEVHAADPSALLDEEVLRVIVARVTAALATQRSVEADRAGDRQIRDGRRVVG